MVAPKQNRQESQTAVMRRLQNRIDGLERILHGRVANALPQSVRPTTSGVPIVTAGSVTYETNTGRFRAANGTTGAWVFSDRRVGCVLDRIANQSITNAATNNIAWDTAASNPDGFWTAGDAITIPAGYGGTYGVAFGVRWLSDPSATSFSRIWVNGADGKSWVYNGDNGSMFRSAVGTIYWYLGAAVTLPLAAGDIVRGMVGQTTGAAINAQARISVIRLGA